MDQGKWGCVRSGTSDAHFPKVQESLANRGIKPVSADRQWIEDQITCCQAAFMSYNSC